MTVRILAVGDRYQWKLPDVGCHASHGARRSSRLEPILDLSAEQGFVRQLCSQHLDEGQVDEAAYGRR